MTSVPSTSADASPTSIDMDAARAKPVPADPPLSTLMQPPQDAEKSGNHHEQRYQAPLSRDLQQPVVRVRSGKGFETACTALVRCQAAGQSTMASIACPHRVSRALNDAISRAAVEGTAASPLNGNFRTL